MSAPIPTEALRVVAIEQLRTSYARLRPGCPRRCLTREPAALPIRVVPSADGSFEVLDGFKRLRAYKEQGAAELAVVIEPPSQPAEHKRLLLAANAPPRTLTALDEARVVCSLIDDDRQSVAAVARHLGKRRQWVERRLAIGRHLCARGQQQLAAGRLAPTLAQGLCDLPAGEQEALPARTPAAVGQHRSGSGQEQGEDEPATPPDVQQVCPANFGNSDIYGITVGDPTP